MAQLLCANFSDTYVGSSRVHQQVCLEQMKALLDYSELELRVQKFRFRRSTRIKLSERKRVLITFIYGLVLVFVSKCVCLQSLSALEEEIKL